MNPLRAATISRESARRSPLRMVQAYMPANFSATGEPDGSIRIVGRDVAGWGLDTFVIPRLASGMIYAVECEPTAAEVAADAYRRWNP